MDHELSLSGVIVIVIVIGSLIYMLSPWQPLHLQTVLRHGETGWVTETGEEKLGEPPLDFSTTKFKKNLYTHVIICPNLLSTQLNFWFPAGVRVAYIYVFYLYMKFQQWNRSRIYEIGLNSTLPIWWKYANNAPVSPLQKL
jgi:hypothetical protein